MRLLIALLSIAALSAAPRRTPSAQRFCTPVNTTSTASTFYPLPIVGVWNGVIPRPGQRFCDPVFGTAMLRLTDDSHTFGTNVLQQSTFSNYVRADGTKNSRAWILAFSTNLGASYVFDFNPVSFTSSGVGVPFVPNGPGGTPLRNVVGQEGMWWSNDTSDPDYQDTVIFTAGNEAGDGPFAGSMRLLKVNIRTNANAVLLTDFTAYVCPSSCSLTAPTPPGGIGYFVLHYCTTSADTTIFGCAFQDGAYFLGGAGYLWWKVGNTTTPSGACPSAGSCILAKWINGVDTTAYNVYPKAPCKVSTADTYTYCYNLDSDFNSIGFKWSIDASGGWLITPINTTTSTTTKPGGLILYANTVTLISSSDAAIVAARLATDWTAVTYKFAQNFGHGSNGSGHTFAIDAAQCNNCLKDWVFSGLSTDPSYVAPANQGTRVGPDMGTMAENVHYGAGAEVALNTYWTTNRAPSDPGGMAKWGNEILWLDYTTQGILRGGHTRSSYSGAFEDEGHIAKSPDGLYIATGTAWNTNIDASLNPKTTGVVRSILIARRPQ